eukprot:TRINITY_DN15580_c0_g1_i2.p1 TRINITY_DN15580_c0_g1~~TRINITY_DN15580_c0_g1_i2.p1  ORF type:complete len:393 (+),score=95.68 TRINITY_DN15580_c0_g1_i2:165-1343(+)
MISSSVVGRAREAQALALLGTASSAELNYLLSRVNVTRLISCIDDRLFGPDNRTALFKLFAEDRIQDISIENRVLLLDAFQRGWTRSSKELAMRNIFLATTGEQLTALKNGIDHGDDYHDLHKLIWEDIDDAGIRAQILAHIQKEAVPTNDFKIMSDVDDTFLCRIYDRRYPKGSTYPGIIQLYHELEIGKTELGRKGDLCFITARPTAVAGAIEHMTKRMLRSRGIAHATVLTGDLRHVVGSRIAVKKFATFGQFQQLYPEYGFVFIGDSGQQDAVFGAEIMLHYASRVHAVFIHDVVNTPEERRAEWRAKGVRFFDTYVGAALMANQLGFISDRGLYRVVAAAHADLVKLGIRDAELLRQREAELKRDEALVRTAVPEPSPIPAPGEAVP